jgi:predicted HicB family RNase H-like nuclease
MANTAPKVKTAFLHCRFDPRLKALAQKAADREGVSLSHLVVQALMFYIKSKYGRGAPTDAPTV